jgi:hypothetical protein
MISQTMAPTFNNHLKFMFRQYIIIFTMLNFIFITYCQADSIRLGSKGPSGGIVFYVDNSGLHGLEAQEKDHDFGEVEWETAMYAANDYGQGWHLPTIHELNLLFEQKKYFAMDTNVYNTYWSSTEGEKFLFFRSTALMKIFSNDGYQSAFIKHASFRVRAVRAF